MPSPKFFGWCSESLLSIHKSVHQIIGSNSRSDIGCSAYVAAIQSLSGKTCGEKLKTVNGIVERIAKNTKEIGEFLPMSDYKEVPPAMLDLIQILVALKMQIKAVITQGLLSDDLDINRKALKADWYFGGGNAHVNASNFCKNIFPYVSVAVRSSIIKKLSVTLSGQERKAEEFFDSLVQLYGREVALPILSACSQAFIVDKIREHQIVLPLKELNILYGKYSDLVVEYLHASDRIYEYDSFIPKLVIDYPQDFIQLYKKTPEKMIKLSNRMTLAFVRNSQDDLVNSPGVFLKLLVPKVVMRHLDRNKYENMMVNLYPKNISDFNLPNMLKQYKTFYKKGDILNLMTENYKKVYGCELFDNRQCIDCQEFLKLLSNSHKVEFITKSLRSNGNNDSFLNKYKYFLPPGDVLPLLKTEAKLAYSAEERSEILGKMITNCGLYESRSSLQEVLNFYKKNFKNERNLVFVRFLHYLNLEFGLDTLTAQNWTVLNDIIFQAYVKKELFQSNVQLIDAFLEACLRNVLRNDASNTGLLDKVMNIMLEHKIEQFCEFNVLVGTEHERHWTDKLLQQVPLKYPEHHDVWKVEHDRLTLCLNFAKAIDNYNRRQGCTRLTRNPKKIERNARVEEKRLKLEAYPWLVRLADEFFPTKVNVVSVKRNVLMRIIRRNAPELYEEKTNALVRIRCIETGEAIQVLRREPKKILDKWQEYLDEARKKLYVGNRAARRFIAESKWYQDIPVRFIEKCQDEFKVEGSIQVLAILLEKDVFEKLLLLYVPQSKYIDLKESNVKENYDIVKSIIKSIRYTNPPVSFNVLGLFCKGDYGLLVNDTFARVANCVPSNKVHDFAMQFVKGTVSLKRKSFRMIQKVSTKTELRDFLKTQMKAEKNFSMRQLISKIIYELFVRSPDEHSWQLMKFCIDELHFDDPVMESLSNLDAIDSRFLGCYIDAYLSKFEQVEQLHEAAGARTKCIILLIENLDSRIVKLMQENQIEGIIKKYFFDVESTEISRAAQICATRFYLLECEERFEYRLNVIIDIIKLIIDNFNKPHPKKPRFYAANYTIQQFFSDLLLEISCSESGKKKEIVESMLKVLNGRLSTWQEPWTHISLNFYKEYLDSSSPTNFGMKCARRIYDLMADFTRSEIMVNEIANCLEDILDNKIYRDRNNPELKLGFIDGLIDEDNYYANLVGIRLLNVNEINMYDERYDKIIRIISKKQNTMIKCSLYQHINKIPGHYDEL